MATWLVGKDRTVMGATIFPRGLWLLITLVALTTATTLPAQQQHADRDATDRPKIALVLSGGAARGISLIGVIKALEKLHVPVDIVTGTSMGAFIGSLYAAGVTGDELQELATKLEWNEGFRQKETRDLWPIREKILDRRSYVNASLGFNDFQLQLPAGVLQGQGGSLLIKTALLPYLNSVDFSDLKIPFACVATDIELGIAVVLNQGNLAQAVKASMTIPGVYTPERINHRYLVDGGITNNMPVDVARDMGGDIIIAVNIGEGLYKHDLLTTPMSVTNQVSTILVRATTLSQKMLLTERDVYIRPEHIDKVGSLNFDQAILAIDQAEATTMKSADKLRRYAIDDASYQKFRQEHAIVKHDPPVIDFIEIDKDMNLADEFFTNRLTVQLGKPLNLMLLKDDLGKINATGLFEKVDFEIKKRGDQCGLVVIARKKSWGPGFLHFGLHFQDDFHGDGYYLLSGRYIRRLVNSWGAEWSVDADFGYLPRVSSEFFQPLGPGSFNFVRVGSTGGSRTFKNYVNGKVKDTYQILFSDSGLDLGRILGNAAELRGGLWVSRTRTSLVEGDASDLSFLVRTIRGAYFKGVLDIDTQDHAVFPTKGDIVGVETKYFRKSLGSNVNSDNRTVTLHHTATFNLHTFSMRGYYASTTDASNELENRPSLGGFLRLSGYQIDEIAGDSVGHLALVYYRPLFGHEIPLYQGFSAEMGGFQEGSGKLSTALAHYGGSLFLGTESPLGSIFLAYGFAGTNHQALYFNLGTPI